jgi:hypothetical protein
MAHKHFCLNCNAVVAEGDFDCERDADHHLWRRGRQRNARYTGAHRGNACLRQARARAFNSAPFIQAITSCIERIPPRPPIIDPIRWSIICACAERASMSNPSSSARVESISREFFICLRIPKIRVERLPHPFIFTHISSWQLCLLKATRGLADFSVRVRAKSGTNPHARWHMPTIVRRRRVGFSDGRSFL